MWKLPQLVWIWPSMFFKFTPSMLRAGSSSAAQGGSSNLPENSHETWTKNGVKCLGPLQAGVGYWLTVRLAKA
jgi:hypothetical protein